MKNFFSAVTDKKGEVVIDWIPKDFQYGRLVMEDAERFREYDGMEIAYPSKETTLLGKEENLDLRIPYGYYIRGKVVTEDGRPYKRSLILGQKHLHLGNGFTQAVSVSPGILTDSAGRFAFVWDRTEFIILQLFTGTITGEMPEFVAPSIKLSEPKRGRAFAPIEIRLEKGAIVRINHPVDSEKSKLKGRISLFEIIEEGEAEISAFLEIPAEKEGFYEIRLPKGKYDAFLGSRTFPQPLISKSFEITGEEDVEIDLE